MKPEIVESLVQAAVDQGKRWICGACGAAADDMGTQIDLCVINGCSTVKAPRRPPRARYVPQERPLAREAIETRRRRARAQTLFQLVRRFDPTPIQERFRARLEATFRERFPRRRKYTEELARKLIPEVCDELLAEFDVTVVRAWKAHNEARARRRGKLWALYENLRPRWGKLRRWESHHIGTYRTQGFGDESYARARAEIHVECVQRLGIHAELIENDESFEVWVEVADNPFDGDLLGWWAWPGMKEFVKMCWARGRQPRVYFPGLNPDFERKKGNRCPFCNSKCDYDPIEEVDFCPNCGWDERDA